VIDRASAAMWYSRAIRSQDSNQWEVDYQHYGDSADADPPVSNIHFRYPGQRPADPDANDRQS